MVPWYPGTAAVKPPTRGDDCARPTVAAVDVWLTAAGDVDGALRAVLGRRVGERPDALRIARSPHGKPYLVDHPGVRFNVSHSGPLAAIAVADREVGVDIEQRRPVHREEAVARRVLTPGEWARYEALDAAGRTAFLLWAWARKEALLKAVGVGIRGSLREVACEPPPDSRWRVVDLEVPGFAAAVAAEGADWVPVLREDGPWPTSLRPTRSGGHD